jgi:undecaprenyl-phosphate 4-deoxy-4-formamido-L-arabinose transferase
MAKPELLSVVIPCYRSAAYLEKTVTELLTELEGWCPFEIILVNDGSPDDVQGVIDRLASRDPRVRYLELGANRGQHYATLRGFALARGDCVVTVDDDGQNPPPAIKAIAEHLLNGNHDVVYGTFRTVEQNAFRRAASRINRWMTKHTLGNTTGIALTNVRALRGQLARVISTASNSTPYIDALIWRTTRRISSVEVPQRARADGLSTYTLWKLIRLWVSHLTLLTVIPLQLASIGSLLVAGLGFLLGAAQLARVLIERQAPPGWLSLFLATTFLFSTFFLFLAIVAAYVGRIYVELNARGLHWVRSSSLLQGGDNLPSKPIATSSPRDWEPSKDDPHGF